MANLSGKVGRLSHSIAWPIWVCTGSALFLGLSSGAWVATYRNSSLIENQKLTIASLTGRTTLLTEALKNQSELAARVDRSQPNEDAPLDQSVAALKQRVPSEIKQVTKSTPKEIALSTSAAQLPAVRNAPPAPSPSNAPTAAPTATAKVDVLQNATAAAPATQKPVVQPRIQTAQNQPLAAASTPLPQSTPVATRIEGVTQEKAGITKLWNNAIDFKSGLRVRIGEKFPSGETLVMIDGPAGRIVTDQRQIIILDK